MSFKNNGNPRDIKKLFSAFMCLLICIAFMALLIRNGFSISNLVFGLIFLYLSIAFFRTSNE